MPNYTKGDIMTEDIVFIVYNPGDVAEQLGIKESTLRKYSLLLEKYGYEFNKNDRGQRGYTDSDIIVLRRVMDLKSGGMTLEKAVLTVSSWVKNKQITCGDMVPERYNNRDMEELKELILELNNKLDQQQVYIEQRLNEHDKLLTQVMRESLETRKLIAAAEEKRPWYKRLFRKK